MKQATKFDWRALSLAWRMGYTIAIPLVVLALGGRFIDKWLHTSPIFLLIGLLLSIIISSIAIWKITVPILQGFSKKNDEKNS